MVVCHEGAKFYLSRMRTGRAKFHLSRMRWEGEVPSEPHESLRAFLGHGRSYRPGMAKRRGTRSVFVTTETTEDTEFQGER